MRLYFRWKGREVFLIHCESRFYTEPSSVSLDKKMVGKIVNFGSAAMLNSTYKKVKAEADKAGIPMDEREFHCKGEFKETVSATKKSVKKAAGLPNIIIQSPMGGYITPADIAKKVPKNTEDVYVRVDENKLYYVLKNGESGDVDIWE